ncbi:MAG: PD-(D/E)XK nuclease family protein [Anaerolineales bacterium]|nr:PD-(D/E)XK nuclease family protein [Anaerolineales bacterium]
MSDIDSLPPLRLPEGFHFSQTNLQDYRECPRRFKLRYMLGLAWPAIESEPAARAANSSWSAAAAFTAWRSRSWRACRQPRRSRRRGSRACASGWRTSSSLPNGKG